MIRFEESDNPDVNLLLRVSKPIFAGNTGLQNVEVFENELLGRVLVLDGIVQTTEGDEFVYHEMLVHPPMFAHGKARRVLIVGGGDGGTLKEVLKHPVEHVTMVEIDRQVIDLCRAHLPLISGDAFDDERLDLIIDDGVGFVAETDRRFDVILVDSTDPVGPGKVLFETAFYTGCRRCLAPDGILVNQNGVPFLMRDVSRDFFRKLRPLFADVAFYLAPVPTFVGGYMAFGWATQNEEARTTPLETLERRYADSGLDTQHYTPEVHRAAFVLPPYIRQLMA